MARQPKPHNALKYFYYRSQVDFYLNLMKKNFTNELYLKSRDAKENMYRALFDFETVEGIESIPVNEDVLKHTGGTVVYRFDYIIQRFASEMLSSGKIDLGIACMKKAHELMQISIISYNKKDYIKLIKQLKDAGRFEDARNQEKKIEAMFPENEQIATHKQYVNNQLKTAKSLSTDYIMTSSSNITQPVCSECAKYRNRVYSISGKDKKFPKLTEEVKKCCCLGFDACFKFTDLTDNFNKVVKDKVKYSNRPFIDDRTADEIKRYEDLAKANQERKDKETEKEKDREDYYLLKEHCPDILPKDFTAYRRIKKANKENYQLLKEKLEQLKEK